MTIWLFCLLEVLAGMSLFFQTYTKPSGTCLFEEHLKKAGLVDVAKVDTSIRVQLRYATSHNFLNRNIYGCLQKGYLQADVARRLARASELLKKHMPSARLLVWDAARPVSAQRIMWNAIPLAENKKHIYLANPARGSIHNYGCAVDLTICTINGVPVDMGTDFDYFGLLAQPVRESQLLREGKLSQAQVNNRKLLRSVMTKAGFFGTNSEWWHFNAYSLQKAKLKFSILP